jgi:hypothetical protein
VKFSAEKKSKSFSFFAKKISRPFLAAFVIVLFLSAIIQTTNISHATPAPTPKTPAEIQKIPGSDDWKDCNNPPPGTKCGDPTGGGSGADVDWDPVTNPSKTPLVPSDQTTMTDIMGKAVEAASGPVRAISGWIAEQVLKAVIGVLWIIASFCKLLVELAGHTLDFTLNPTLYNFTNNDMITFGWTMVRDVCNLFFLLILLFIAFCTILQIDKYHAKKTLLTLILMALLINFSKPIAIFIFDGAQIAMNYFLKSIDNAVGGGATSGIYNSINGIAEIVYKHAENQKEYTIDVALQYLFAILFLFILAVAYFTIAIFLIIRIVAVMVLIIVSPLAFLATAVPDFQKMSSSWWSALFSYSYYGPAVAFFLLLATKLQSFTIGLPKLVPADTSGKQMDLLLNNILRYLTTVVFLYAAVIMGKQFGLYASEAITSRATKGINWGARNLTGYGLAAKGGRGVANVFKRHKQAAGEAAREHLKQNYPRLHKWTTKEGADAAAKKSWNEVFGNTDANKQQQEAVGKHEKDMKDKNFTADDYENELKKSTDATRRIAAAMALAKLGKLDMTQYEKAIKDFEQNPAFKKLFDGEVAKKNIHIVINSEIEQAAAAAARSGGTMTQAQKNTIIEKHIDNLDPEQLAKQNVLEIVRIEQKHGSSHTRDTLLDLQTSTDPKKQKLFEKFYSGLSTAERKRLEKGDPRPGDPTNHIDPVI